MAGQLGEELVADDAIVLEGALELGGQLAADRLGLAKPSLELIDDHRVTSL